MHMEDDNYVWEVVHMSPRFLPCFCKKAYFMATTWLSGRPNACRYSIYSKFHNTKTAYPISS